MFVYTSILHTAQLKTNLFFLIVANRIWSNSCGPNELYEIAFKGNHKWFTTVFSSALPLSTIHFASLHEIIANTNRFVRRQSVHWHGWLRAKLNCKCVDGIETALAMARAATMAETVARHCRKKFSTPSNYYVNGCQFILPHISGKWRKWMRPMCLKFQRLVDSGEASDRLNVLRAFKRA